MIWVSKAAALVFTAFSCGALPDFSIVTSLSVFLGPGAGSRAPALWRLTAVLHEGAFCRDVPEARTLLYIEWAIYAENDKKPLDLE